MKVQKTASWPGLRVRMAKAFREIRPTNGWSCRLRWSFGSKECRRCGSLRFGDSAAQLNSMLSAGSTAKGSALKGESPGVVKEQRIERGMMEGGLLNIALPKAFVSKALHRIRA